jgi:hypothetical protein
MGSAMKTKSQIAHKRTLVRGVVLVILALVSCTASSAQRQKWSAQQANDWYKQQPWLVGSNYVPATAINELEMWQEDSFDPQRIDRELGWAESIGMNTMRVFLHDLLWKDPERLQTPHRYIPHHLSQAWYQADVCSLRFLLGSKPTAR